MQLLIAAISIYFQDKKIKCQLISRKLESNANEDEIFQLQSDNYEAPNRAQLPTYENHVANTNSEKNLEQQLESAAEQHWMGNDDINNLLTGFSPALQVYQIIDKFNYFYLLYARFQSQPEAENLSTSENNRKVVEVNAGMTQAINVNDQANWNSKPEVKGLQQSEKITPAVKKIEAQIDEKPEINKSSAQRSVAKMAKKRKASSFNQMEKKLKYNAENQELKPELTELPMLPNLTATKLPTEQHDVQNIDPSIEEQNFYFDKNIERILEEMKALGPQLKADEIHQFEDINKNEKYLQPLSINQGQSLDRIDKSTTEKQGEMQANICRPEDPLSAVAKKDHVDSDRELQIGQGEQKTRLPKAPKKTTANIFRADGNVGHIDRELQMGLEKQKPCLPKIPTRGNPMQKEEVDRGQSILSENELMQHKSKRYKSKVDKSRKAQKENIEEQVRSNRLPDKAAAQPTPVSEYKMAKSMPNLDEEFAMEQNIATQILSDCTSNTSLADRNSKQMPEAKPLQAHSKNDPQNQKENINQNKIEAMTPAEQKRQKKMLKKAKKLEKEMEKSKEQKTSSDKTGEIERESLMREAASLEKTELKRKTMTQSPLMQKGETLDNPPHKKHKSMATKDQKTQQQPTDVKKKKKNKKLMEQGESYMMKRTKDHTQKEVFSEEDEPLHKKMKAEAKLNPPQSNISQEEEQFVPSTQNRYQAPFLQKLIQQIEENKRTRELHEKLSAEKTDLPTNASVDANLEVKFDRKSSEDDVATNLPSVSVAYKNTRNCKYFKCIIRAILFILFSQAKGFKVSDKDKNVNARPIEPRQKSHTSFDSNNAISSSKLPSEDELENNCGLLMDAYKRLPDGQPAMETKLKSDKVTLLMFCYCIIYYIHYIHYICLDHPKDH